MGAAEIVVALGGTLLVAFVLWFYFGKRKGATARTPASGLQEVDVTVRGGYSPDLIEVEAGRPVRLTFVREEENPCTAELVFPGLGLVRELPVGRPVTVEFTPEGPGEYAFHCGMNMVRGKVIVAGRGPVVVPTYGPAAAAHP